jgi:hypothetical protein
MNRHIFEGSAVIGLFHHLHSACSSGSKPTSLPARSDIAGLFLQDLSVDSGWLSEFHPALLFLP